MIAGAVQTRDLGTPIAGQLRYRTRNAVWNVRILQGGVACVDQFVAACQEGDTRPQVAAQDGDIRGSGNKHCPRVNETPGGQERVAAQKIRATRTDMGFALWRLGREPDPVPLNGAVLEHHDQVRASRDRRARHYADRFTCGYRAASRRAGMLRSDDPKYRRRFSDIDAANSETVHGRTIQPWRVDPRMNGLCKAPRAR
jgi:hypothetical protein